MNTATALFAPVLTHHMLDMARFVPRSRLVSESFNLFFRLSSNK